MKSIDGQYEDLYVINKSKFYSFAYPVTTEEEIKNILAGLRDRFADATHICFAYSLSSPRLEKADDNGEPSGTAGKPLLELIKKKNMDNVLVVSVRYFGGIKLGAGGLVRAYTNSGNLVLDKAKIIELVLQKTYRLEVEIALGNKVQETLRGLGANILSCVYTDKLTLEFVGEYKDKIMQIYPTAKIELVGEKLVCAK